MGDETVDIAVADAGPLIHLSEIDCLSLLTIFKALHIPNAVWSETVGHNRVAKDDILSLNIVQQHSLSQSEIIQFAQENSLEELQDGELECLYLCQHIGIPILLTDDMAVREESYRLNLTPIGSLGIVVKAYRLGHIPLSKAKQHIASLYDISSLFVTRAIVEIAIEQLNRK
jgi:predicted nucleic acid-binding protein